MLENDLFPPRVVTLVFVVWAHCRAAVTSASVLGNTTAEGTGLRREFHASMSIVQLLLKEKDDSIPAADKQLSRVVF